MNIVITGGHHSSALPVLKILAAEHPEVKISWFGHKYSLKGNKNPSLEYQEITGLGIHFYDLHAGKVYKTYNISRLLKVPLGFLHAFFLLLKIRPKVVLAFGGYLAVPTVLAAWLLGIPSVIHEQTVVVGYANKLISKYAKKVLISFQESAKYFPNEKVIYVGLPLREELFTVKTDVYQLNPDLPTIYVTAGKTGSHKINQAILASMSELLQRANIIHQCGDNSVYSDFDDLVAKYEEFKDLPGIYIPKKFIFGDEIGEVYAKSGYVICRGGIHTVSEILALRKQALIIPIPWVSHNEQFLNAKLVQDANLGTILPEDDLTDVNKFMQSVLHLLEQPTQTALPGYTNEAAQRIVYETLSVS